MSSSFESSLRSKSREISVFCRKHVKCSNTFTPLNDESGTVQEIGA